MSAFADLLAVPADTPIFFTAMTLGAWGATLTLTGQAGRTMFTLRYEECRELRWRTYPVFGGITAQIALVDFSAGRDGHRSPAQLLTDSFALWLLYGKMRIEVG